MTDPTDRDLEDFWNSVAEILHGGPDNPNMLPSEARELAETYQDIVRGGFYQDQDPRLTAAIVEKRFLEDQEEAALAAFVNHEVQEALNDV